VDINSSDGAWLRMRPLAYQPGVQPPTDPEELDGWDDWLVIAVDVRTGDGRTWSFSDPCLTTDEARDLERWLRQQEDEASASVAPVRERDAGLRFIEPNLAFRLLAARPARRRLEVAFSHESLPPWLDRSCLGQVYPLVLDVAADDLAAGADQWAREIQPFPRRAPA
jgi:hypothetical protein